MKWVTREGAKTDRVACPWLIRKFIDPQAQIVFVPKDQVLEVARREGGKSFDCPGADYTHRDGKCSLEAPTGTGLRRRVGDLPLLQLFLAFLRLGATAFGGLGMMAHIRRECVERRQWLTGQEFKEGMALCQAVPGATVVQMTTYVGYRMGGLRGALAAAAAFCLPALLLMAGLSAAYFRFGDLPQVKALFHGLAPVVVAMLLNAVLSLGRISIHDWREVILALMAFGALVLRVHPVAVLVGAAVISLVLFRADRQAPAAAQRIES